MKQILFIYFIFYASGVVAQAPVTRVEPPFWWVGMKHHELELLVQGHDIAQASVTIQYPGVTISKTTKGDNPNFLFIDLLIGDEAKPGRFTIEFLPAGKKKKITYSYELKERDDNMHQGPTTRDVIYLITPDRFANENPSNDESALMLEKKNRTFHGGRHGGDIEGMIARIDYMNDLGITSVWSTPVLENNMPEFSYHGYAITDYYRVDPRIGSNESYRKFADGLHQKKMKIIMDMVFNHCGLRHWWMKDMPFTDWIHYYPKTVETNHAMASLSDPHAAASDREQMEKGWFVPTMPDLNHDNPFLATYLIQNSIWWIEYAGLDGVRQDTYPYNKKEFMIRWAQYIHEEYPDFFLVGESWVDNEAQESYWSPKAGDRHIEFNSKMSSMTDFPLCFAMHRAFGKSGNIDEVYRVLTKDFLYYMPDHNMIFADNHDMDRFFYSIGEDVNRFKSAITFLLTTRGIPQFYYGSEIGMKGHGNHGDIREDFPGGWADDHRSAFTRNGRNAVENEIFDHVHKLLQWRRKSDAIQHGELKHFVPEDNVYVYNRKSADESVVVIINNGDQPKKLAMKRYEEILNGYDGARDVLEGKRIENLKEIDIDAHSSLVLELTPQLKASK